MWKRQTRNKATSKGADGQDIELNNRQNHGQSNGGVEMHPRYPHLPRYNHNGHRVHKHIHPDGESGRRFFNPLHFVRIALRSSSKVSMAVNILWPFVPVAIALHFAFTEPTLAQHRWIFAMNYIAMVPTANLIGFAGQELARKLPKVLGIVLETFLGGFVEIILFVVLLSKSTDGGEAAGLPGTSLVPVIRAAILGSILANLLLCLGTCFFVGGMNRHEQEFDEAISEVGSGLLLVAGFGLLVPSAFFSSLRSSDISLVDLELRTLTISRATAVLLLVAFLIYVWFQMRTHNGIYHSVLEQDEEKDEDRHKDLKKDKFTFTECIIALIVALTFVSMHAVFLVEEIEPIISAGGVSDSFMGLILVPLVEKFAEHLTAVDEAHDNQMNFALAHVLGATIQTALFNSSLIVIIGWGINKGMDLNFEVFNIVMLIMAIVVVGNFLRDLKSNYLEGSLCILVYIAIAVAAFYYPNPVKGDNDSEGGAAEEGGVAAEATAAATEVAKRLLMG